MKPFPFAIWPNFFSKSSNNIISGSKRVDATSPTALRLLSLIKRNSQWAKKNWAGMLTQLSPEKEMQYRKWIKQSGVPETKDYDMRGWYSAYTDPNHPDHSKTVMSVNASDGLPHYDDYWKTPYHHSFSNESKYATPDAPAWNHAEVASGKTNVWRLSHPTAGVIFEEHPMAAKPQVAPDSSVSVPKSGSLNKIVPGTERQK